jgi:uncharacterized protein YceH (UPF0502 family)
MKILTDPEQRVLGALIEKQIATPDYYPLTLNALVNACNQKNQRDPVVSFTEGDVERALDGLRAKQLALQFEGGASRVLKFGNTLAKTLELAPPEVAVLCVLLLRGPQTPGELRSRTAYLHAFADLPAVEEVLEKLATHPEPLAVKLPRAPGSREARFAHLLGGPVSAAAESTSAPATVSAVEPAAMPNPSHEERIAKLEAEVALLRSEFDELKAKCGI